MELWDVIEILIAVVFGMELERILKFRKFFFTLIFKWFKIKKLISESKDVYDKLKEKVEDKELKKEINEMERAFKEIFK